MLKNTKIFFSVSIEKLMTSKKIIILLPKINNSGPIKGAFALANGICNDFNVSIYSLEKVNTEYKDYNTEVEIKSLNSIFNLKILKIFSFLKVLEEYNKEYDETIVISFTFLADLFLSLTSKKTKKISSLRLNIFEDYKFLFGFLYKLILKIHLIVLEKMDLVVVMHQVMKNKLNPFINTEIKVIPNFIDEKSLAKFKKQNIHSEIIKLVFCGSLIKRKDPFSLIHAVNELRSKNKKIILNIIGSGPLLQKLRKKVKQLNLDDCIFFHGHVDDPYEIMIDNDLFILPSITEGISRAMLEALYLGLYCIVKDVDGNSDIVQDNFNGFLFKDNIELCDKILDGENLKNYNFNPEKNLLPSENRYEINVKRYLKVINEI